MSAEEHVKQRFDAIVVLGAGNLPNGSLNVDSTARAKKAVELFNRGLADRVIFSGSHAMRLEKVPPVSEAAGMAKLARTLGVPDESIYIEEKSQDTFSNAYFVKIDYLIPNNWKHILIVAAEFHSLRAMYIFNHVLGSKYHCELAVSDSGLRGNELELKIKRERKILTVIKQMFIDQGIPAGDTAAIQDYIKTKHTAYAAQPAYTLEKITELTTRAEPDPTPFPAADVE
jgi:uncharacterized SAM-binding protein YcdF (DUF218 family)